MKYNRRLVLESPLYRLAETHHEAFQQIYGNHLRFSACFT